MTKLNEIENSIKQLDGAGFQKLADTYMYKQGYTKFQSLGSVVGSNKVRKGTPDTLIELDNGKYVLAEYTTQQNGLYDKLLGDVMKCLDENYTGIKVSQIEEIVICHTSQMSADQLQGLTQLCHSRGVNLNVFGINKLSQDLYHLYPGLARDFLGVEVDTGQIVDVKEFIHLYEKNKLATPLSTKFQFRSKDLQLVMDGLESNSVIILSGGAGVGKSRLALEACRRFVDTHPDYSLKCVYNCGADIFADTRTHFSEARNYIVFIDDANRLSGFDYIIDRLNRHESGDMKIVVTVRQYALEQIVDATRRVGGVFSLVLELLSDKELRDIIEQEHEITNSLYLKRISDIASGNPRLAMMAAAVAKRENRLESISDASALYDEYFGSVAKELSLLYEPDFLKAAGIIAFFRIVDRSNIQLMETICSCFEVTGEQFWKAVSTLHQLELVDVYENEVVKVSDQVLSTYLLYLYLFKLNDKHALHNMFRDLFPRFRRQFVDALNPILSAFDAPSIKSALQPIIRDTWSRLEKDGEYRDLVVLMDLFWFVLPSDVLAGVHKMIQAEPPEIVDIMSVNTKVNTDLENPSILSILSHFYQSRNEELNTAITLIVELFLRRPSCFGKILGIMTHQYGYQSCSHLNGFEVQKRVVDTLEAYRRNDHAEIVDKLFIAVASRYLETEFEQSDWIDGRTYTVSRFRFPATETWMTWRRTIWTKLLPLFERRTLSSEVLSVIENFGQIHTEPVHEVMVADAEMILEWIARDLPPDGYRSCVAVQAFLGTLARQHIPYDSSLGDLFTNEEFERMQFLMARWEQQSGIDIHDYPSHRKKTLHKYVSQLTLEEHIQVVDDVCHVWNELEDNERGRLHQGFIELLEQCAEAQPDVFVTVIKHYLGLGDPLQINPIVPVENLVAKRGVRECQSVIKSHHFSSRTAWLLRSYEFSPVTEIQEEDVEVILGMYRIVESSELPRDLNYLLNYKNLRSSILVDVVQILLDRIEAGESACTSTLSSLFYPKAGAPVLVELSNNIRLLERAYLKTIKVLSYVDYEGTIFNEILLKDPDFIVTLVEDMIDDSGHHPSDRIGQRFSIIWTHQDCHTLMLQVTDRLYRKWKSKYYFTNPLHRFFDALPNDVSVVERQDVFLSTLIEQRIADMEFIRFLFEMICDFTSVRRLKLLVCFLEHNHDLENFKCLSLHPKTSSWSGSAVPVIQEQIEYWESVLTLLPGVTFIYHRQHVQRIIDSLEVEIEQEKKREFAC